jgi:hypothetical protein
LLKKINGIMFLDNNKKTGGLAKKPGCLFNVHGSGAG